MTAGNQPQVFKGVGPAPVQVQTQTPGSQALKERAYSASRAHSATGIRCPKNARTVESMAHSFLHYPGLWVHWSCPSEVRLGDLARKPYEYMFFSFIWPRAQQTGVHGPNPATAWYGTARKPRTVSQF